MAPKGKIFKKYIEIELYLGNFDRCRTLYEKYAELEKNLSETDRARSIYELAIAQPALDTPEVLWKVFDHSVVL
jgi:crooked neck